MNEIINKGQTPTILLYGDIGVNEDGTGISGARVAQAILDLENKGYKTLDVRINSNGGNVMDGYSIYSAIKESSMFVTTYNDGMAGSIASIILLAGSKVYAQPYSSILIHEPYTEATATDKIKNLLESTRASLASMISTRSKLPLDQVESLMKKETIFTAQEAKEQYGLVDEILPIDNFTKKLVENSVLKNKSIYTQENCAVTIYNACKSIIQKKRMDKITNKLKLQNEASEDAIVEAIEKIQTKDTSIETENTDLKDKLALLQDELKAYKIEKEKSLDREALEVVENAIQSGKFKSDAKESMIILAKSNIEAFKTSFGAITPTVVNKQAVKITDNINSNNTTKNYMTNNLDLVRASWSFKDWRKNDPSGLKKLEKEQPEMYNALLDIFKNEVNSNIKNSIQEVKF